MRVACYALLCLLLAGACEKSDSSSESKKWSIQQIYQSAQSAAAQGRLDEAERLYRQIIEKDPAHTGARIKLARMLAEKADKENNKEKLNQARMLAWEATRLDPKSQIAWEELARIEQKLGNYSQAAECWRQVIKLSSANTATSIQLGAALLLAGRTDEALKAFSDAVDSKPDDWRLRLEYAAALEQAGKNEQAAEQLRSIPLDAAEAAAALEQLGNLLGKSGDFRGMREHYLKLVELRPRDAEAWAVLGLVEEKLGERKAAVEHLEKALEISPRQSAALLGLARLRLKEDRQKARQLLQQADELLGMEPQLAAELAETVLAYGDRAWAASVLRRGLILLEEDKEQREKLERMLGQIR